MREWLLSEAACLRPSPIFAAVGTENTFGGSIDDISLTAVPLPAALPLFGTGLGLIGLFSWFRRRRETEV